MSEICISRNENYETSTTFIPEIEHDGTRPYSSKRIYYKIAAMRILVITKPAMKPQHEILFSANAPPGKMKVIGGTCHKGSIPHGAMTNVPTAENAFMTLRDTRFSVRAVRGGQEDGVEPPN